MVGAGAALAVGVGNGTVAEGGIEVRVGVGVGIAVGPFMGEVVVIVAVWVGEGAIRTSVAVRLAVGLADRPGVKLKFCGVEGGVSVPTGAAAGEFTAVEGNSKLVGGIINPVANSTFAWAWTASTGLISVVEQY